MSLIAELKRRNVLRVAAGYAVGAWVLVQVSTTVLPLFGAPDWIARVLVVVLLIGVIPVLVLAWMFELTPQGIKTQGEADAQGLTSRFAGPPLNLAMGVLLLLALGLFFLGRYSAAPGGAGAPVALHPGAGVNQASIAVLPFVNMSADPSNEYFSDGLSETLLDMLSQVADLKVPARTSSFAFKGKAEDVRGIGATLGVANLLEGSVQKSGDEVRITAQLVRTSDGTHVWSKHFDRKLTDVFKIQDEIATEVVGALKVSLVGNAEQHLIQKRTENVAAYQEYLKGIALMPDRKVADLRAAAAHFQRAIELDPGFARAYVGVGDAYALLSEYGSVTAEERTRGQQYVEHALELAPELGEAHASLAARLANADDMAGAEREYKRAIELAPSYATAYHWYSELLQGLARPDEALAMAMRAVALDPLSPVVQMNLSDMQEAAGHEADARATVKRLAAAHPEYALAHRAEAQYASAAGDLVAALRAMKAHDRADPDAIGYSMGRCEILFDFGAKDASHACVADFARRAPGHPRVLHAQAQLASADGELEQSVALFERAPSDPVDHAVALLRVGRAPDALKLLEPIAPKLMREPLPELVTQREQRLALLVGAILLHVEGAQSRGRTLIEHVLAARGEPGNQPGASADPWFGPICFEVLGRRDEALAALQRDVAAGGFVGLTHIDWEPLFKSLRADPRYDKIVAPARAKAQEQVRLAQAAGLL